MMGVFTSDYYMVRKKKVKLSDLYHPSPKGIYWFTHGVNFRSYTAWILGFAPSIGGMASVNPANNIPIGLTRTFYTGFISGYAISFLVHWGLNLLFPPAGLGEIDSYDSVCLRPHGFEKANHDDIGLVTDSGLFLFLLQFGTFTPEEAIKLGIEPNMGERTNPARAEGEDESVYEKDAISP